MAFITKKNVDGVDYSGDQYAESLKLNIARFSSASGILEAGA